MQLVLQNPRPYLPKGRLPLIDEIKGYGLLLVILYHIWGVMGWPNKLHGEVGVDLFLMLSGFTLVLNGTQLPWREFVTRRVIRIFPAYWLALFVFSAGLPLLGSQFPSTGSLWLHVFGVHAFAPVRYFSEINNSFWFISLILALYLLFIVLRPFLHRVAAVLGIGMVLTTLVAFSYIAADHSAGLVHLAVRIPSFFAGLAVGIYLTQKETTISVSPMLVAGLLGLTILGFTKAVFIFYAVAAAGVMGTYILIAETIRPFAPGKFLLKGFQFIGVYSYEIFLFHQPLIREYNFYFYRRFLHVEPSQEQLKLGIGVGLFASVLIAVLVHKATARVFHQFSGGMKPISSAPTPVTA